MKSFLLRCGVLLAAFVLMIATPARAADMAERVPADAIVYVSWQGMEANKAAYDQSRLKAIMDQCSLPKFLSETVPQLITNTAGPDAEPVLSALGTLWRKPAALYVGPMEFAPNVPPNVKFALVCDAGKDAEILAANLEKVVRMLPRAPFPVNVRREGEVVALTVGELGDPSLALLMGKKSTVAALATDKAYIDAVAQVKKDSLFVGYVSVTNWVKMGDTLLIAMPEWVKTRDALNLGGLKSAAFSFGFDGKEWGAQAFLGTDGSKTGLLSLMDGPGLTDANLKVIPQDATWFAAVKFDLDKVVTEALNIAEKIDPKYRKTMEEGIAGANKGLGIDIQKDLLAAFGDTWTAYCAPSVGGGGFMGITIVNTPRDAAKLNASLEKIEMVANQAMHNEGGPRMGMPQFAIRKITIGGAKIRHIPLFAVNPAWTVTENRFYIGLYPNAVAGAMDAGKLNTSILDNADFVAARKRIDVASPFFLSYLDTPKTAPEGYTILQLGQTLAQSFVGDIAPADLIPPLHKLVPQLSPSITAGWADASGYHMKMIEPIPASFLLGGLQGPLLTSPPLLVAILLPSLGRAREISNRSYEAANATGIMKSAVVWANDNNDKLPEHLAQLIVSGYIAPKMLVNRRTGTQPLVITDEMMKAAQKDWHAIEKDVDAHCDWIYLGKGQTATIDASEVVLFCKPNPDLMDGITVGWADAHASFERYFSLDSVFEYTNEKRKEKNLPPIDVRKLFGDKMGPRH